MEPTVVIPPAPRAAPDAGTASFWPDGDCAPDDPWVGPGQEEICADWVDDDCDGGDGACPTTDVAVEVPAWDCQGMPPNEVVVWAPIAGRTDACGMIYASAGSYYFSPVNVDLECPGGYQGRLHAWTTVEDECEELLLVAYHDGELPESFEGLGPGFDYDRQPLSNACRKWVMHLAGDQAYSFFAGSLLIAFHRLGLYPQLEVGCHAWTGSEELEAVTLSKTPFMQNQGFVHPN